METASKRNAKQRFKAPKLAQRKKSGTQTTKKHRFESFSQRISKLNIDPIRRNDARTRINDENESSHFISALETWKDRNLAQNFTEFVRSVEPLCQSLPQIIHYEGEIVELLFTYIEKADPLCLEALLNLVTHLARDLGARFEGHFERTVMAVSRLAAHHSSVEVIEWSFTCLAWLFKYLSRLLVPDLRPLYNLMAPLLGKDRHKSFISRFAAESMSFLVRKAGTQYRKNRSPLDTIVAHAFQDLSQTTNDSKPQYQRGLVVLFSESIKGIQKSAHTGGPAIMGALIKHLMSIAAEELPHLSDVKVVVEGIIIDVIHHTDAQGFTPILDAFMENSHIVTANTENMRACTRLLLVLMATRKGSRIEDWSSISQQVVECTEQINSNDEISTSLVIMSTLNAMGAALQFAPFEAALPLSQILMRNIDNKLWAPYFIPFCTFVAGLGKERFEILVLPAFQKFIVSNWITYERQICYAVPFMNETEVLMKNKIRMPRDWLDHVEHNLRSLHGLNAIDDKNELLPLCHGYLHLLESVDSEPECSIRIAEILQSLVLRTLSDSDEMHIGPLGIFSICHGLQFALKYLGANMIDEDGLSRLLRCTKTLGQRPVFLRVLSNVLERSSGKSLHRNSNHVPTVIETLIENLASPSHDLRDLSLTVLSGLYRVISEEGPQALVVAQDLENSPFTIEDSRAASLKIRKLGSLYGDCVSDPWMGKAIPAYCFGLLHVRLAPLWSDACDVLRSMADISESASFIIDRGISWLKALPPANNAEQKLLVANSIPDRTNLYTLPDFQCASLSFVDDTSFRTSREYNSARERLQSGFASFLEPEPIVSKENRAQGLRVLSAMPHLAEKRSRSLVPILLDWTVSQNLKARVGEEADTDSETLGSHDSPPRNDHARWSRKDQKAILELFSRFINPSVLFRSKDVYNSLLELLCYGDVDIQKSSLKALLTWKSPALTPYRENLFNLLDEARFREELTTFLDDQDGSVILTEHRPGLMPVLLRLLYGRITTRSGIGSTRGSQEARRKAALISLARYGEEAVVQFASIALGPLETLPSLFTESGDLQEDVLNSQIMPLRRQTGMLKMLRDMLVTVPDRMEPSISSIANAVIACLTKSTRSQKSNRSPNVTEEDSSLERSVRHEAYACLILLYAKCPQDDWMSRIEKPIFDWIINPKLENLAVETAQAPSSLLKLFSVWSSTVQTVRLLTEPNNDLLATVSDCLIEASAKLEVRKFVLNDIIKPFIENIAVASVEDPRLSLHSDIAHIFFTRVTEVLRHTHDKECLEACVEIFISLQPFVTGFRGSKDVIEATLRFLAEPSRNVNPRLKGELLKLLQQFMPAYNFGSDPELFEMSIISLSKLFSFFHDAQNRNNLVALFAELATRNEALRKSSRVCAQLNSYSDRRLNEPNFQEREAAFQALNDNLWSEFDAQQWLPVVHNLLFLIREREEQSTRSNASIGLRRFIQAANSSTTASPNIETGFLDILNNTVIPAVQSGMQEESELIRNEYISILAHLVSCDIESMQDMRCILTDDDETSFFNNILHIQPHRRNRALQRLSLESAKLSSLNVGRFFIPLMETIIADKAAEAHNFSNEAVNALEYLAEGLEWKRYRALLQRMVQDPQTFSSKLRIRALGAVLTGLHHAHIKRQVGKDAILEPVQKAKPKTDTSDNLASTLPDGSALQKSLFSSVLSKLLDQIHYQDEASIDIRILVAVFAVRLILVFPTDEINNHLPAILVDICNILKSRAQDARDSTRKTLADIAAIIGPSYFGFVVKQLRSSLKRGYQLHVLSYTVHSLLVSTSSMFKTGSLDYCLPDVVAVIMDDAFGVTAQDKEATGYVSGMREVKKKALGFDSMEIVATMVTLPHVSTLLKPIGAHLDKSKPKTEKADELFRRIREGLRRNESVKNRDILILGYEILTEAMQGKGEAQNMELRARKMTCFALELLRRVLDKHEELKTPENLGGFLPMFDALAALSDEEIQMSLSRLLASIIKVPLKQLDDYAGNFIRRAKKTIENASSTNEPLCQASLRLISAILRERPAAVIKKANFEMDMAFLLKKITPDLQEPARQGERDRQVAAFNFLKAIMARGVLVMELYETMDTVREVMITSQEIPIPDLARSVYSKFILDYFPEGGKGMAKQLEFLTTNMQYEHARGRKSVMEVVAFIFNKMESSSLQPALVNFFIPLVLVLVVDQDKDCRNGAELLLRRAFERADKERTKLFRSQLMQWQQADTNILWRQVALQVWNLFFNVHTSATKEALAVHGNACEIVEMAVDDNDDSDSLKPLLVGSMKLLKCLCELFPDIAFACNTSGTWFAITAHLTSEEPPVRAAAAQLISVYFADFARSSSKSSKPQQLPLTGSNGLDLTAEIILPIAKASMTLLSSAHNNADVIDQTIQNLAFIGRVSSSENANPEPDSQLDNQSILNTLFTQSSAILRAEIDVSHPPLAKLAILKLVTALSDIVSVDTITPLLNTILLPLHHFTDPSIATPTSTDPSFGEIYEQIVTQARELLQSLREKVGGETFLREMGRVQRLVRERREERRAKRAVEAVAEPEKAEAEKRRKREREKEKRQGRNIRAAGMRRGW